MLTIHTQPQQPLAQKDSNIMLVKPTKQRNHSVKRQQLKNGADVTKTAASVAVDDSEGQDVALFHRNEIKVGQLVGSGSFSEVYEITAFSPATPTTKRRSFSFTKSFSSSTTSLTSVTSTAAMEPSRRRKRRDLVEELEKPEHDKSRFVIKQLHQKLLADPKLFRRAVKDMVMEVKIMSQLEHPHIAQLRATAVGGSAALQNGKHDSYFLVLDRLYETLDDRITHWNEEKIQMGPSYYLDAATNDTKIALKANYALQIASALNYLHERRIIFRDLKPQNIGFKEVHPDEPHKDVLALFDFGLSRHLPSSEKANEDGLFRMSMVGTRRYMAPEVVVSKTYNTKADTYSWALVFFELVTQQRPYDGIQRNEHKEFICHQGKRPKIYSYYGLPAELERMMRFAWAQDVSKRLTMDVVCDTLTSFLKGTIHEGCAQQPKPALIPDDSAMSLHTAQTMLTTTDTFSMDDNLSLNYTHHNNNARAMDPPGQGPVAGSEPVLVSEVPQAIAVSASATSTDAETHTTHDLSAIPTWVGRKKQASLCERCFDVFKGFKLFHHQHPHSNHQQPQPQQRQPQEEGEEQEC